MQGLDLYSAPGPKVLTDMNFDFKKIDKTPPFNTLLFWLMSWFYSIL